MKKFLRTIIIFAVYAILPTAAFGQASLFIEPSSGSYFVGNTFSVVVSLNSAGQAVNAGSAVISFDRNRLSVVSLGYSQSVFTLWPIQPLFDNTAGTVTFTGGVPSPGFTGADGALLRITFKAKATGSAAVIFQSGSVLANDGVGTNIADNLLPATYRIQDAPPPKTTPTEPTGPSTPASPPPAVVQTPTQPPIAPPIFTDWPRSLAAGKIITVEGTAASSSRILLSISKDGGAAYTDETYSWPSGKFVYTMKSVADAGNYQVSAAVEGGDGRKSDSASVSIPVSSTSAICIGNTCIEKASVIRFVIYLLFILIMLLLLILILYLWIKTRELEKQQSTEVRKLRGTEDELVGMIDDFKKIQTTDRNYRVEVTDEIQRLSGLRDDVMRQIDELREGAMKAAAAAKAAVGGDRRESAPTVTPITPVREPQPAPAPAIAANSATQVSAPARSPIDEILSARRAKESAPQAEQFNRPPTNISAGVEQKAEEIPVYNPFDDMEITYNGAPTRSQNTATRPADLPQSTTQAPANNGNVNLSAGSVNAGGVSAPSPTPQTYNPSPSAPRAEVAAPIGYSPTIKGTPFSAEEIGVPSYDERPAPVNSPSEQSAAAAPVGVPQESATGGFMNQSAPASNSFTIPGRPVNTAVGSAPISSTPYSTPPFSNHYSTPPVDNDPGAARRPVMPQPEKWPPKDFGQSRSW